MHTTYTQSNEEDLVWQWVDYELQHDRSVEIIATGQSMSPMIPSGSRLVLTPINKASKRICVGQVVYIPQIRVIHRVIARWNDTIWIKGDRLPYCDTIYYSSAITAYVSQIKRPQSPDVSTSFNHTKRTFHTTANFYPSDLYTWLKYTAHQECLHHPFNKLAIIGSCAYSTFAMSRRLWGYIRNHSS